MHGRRSHQPQPRRLWLFSGTGDGPPLARALLAQGWRLRVSVVTAEAARPYPQHRQLQVWVGPLGGSAALVEALRAAALAGEPFTAVIDATHPFAARIHHSLAAGCRQAALPLLALERPAAAALAPLAGLEWLEQLDALARAGLSGERLLLAIGARHLGAAVAASPGAIHHARLLPRPSALVQALAAGVAPERIACLQPGAAGAVETALVRQWRIQAIVARQSGPPTELLWRRVAAATGCRLLLLRQPTAHQDPARPDPAGPIRLDAAALLARLAAWPA